MNHNNPGRRRHIPQHQSKRGGSGGGNGNSGGNRGGQRPMQSGGGSQVSLNKIYDSAGPDVKIKGTAAHIYEKYISLARDATSSGDRVLSENYTQHAEHYLRIINEIQEQLQSMYRPAFDGSEPTTFAVEEDDQPSVLETSPPREETQTPDMREHMRDRRDAEEPRQETDREQRPPKRPLNIPFLKRTQRPDDERGERQRQPRPQQQQPRERDAQSENRERQPKIEQPNFEAPAAKNEDPSAGGRRTGVVRRRIVAKPTEGSDGEGSASE